MRGSKAAAVSGQEQSSRFSHLTQCFQYLLAKDLAACISALGLKLDLSKVSPDIAVRQILFSILHQGNPPGTEKSQQMEFLSIFAEFLNKYLPDQNKEMAIFIFSNFRDFFRRAIFPYIARHIELPEPIVNLIILMRGILVPLSRDQNMGEAHFQLGMLYWNFPNALPSIFPDNKGVSTSCSRLFQKAIEQKHVGGNYGLAVLSLIFKVLPEDSGKAKIEQISAHLEAVAQSGHVYFNYELGKAIFHSNLLPEQRISLSLRHFKIAAEKGDKSAQTYVEKLGKVNAKAPEVRASFEQQLLSEAAVNEAVDALAQLAQDALVPAEKNNIEKIVDKAIKRGLDAFRETYQGYSVQVRPYHLVDLVDGQKMLRRVFYISPPENVSVEEFVTEVKKRITASEVTSDHIMTKLPSNEKEWTKTFPNIKIESAKRVFADVVASVAEKPMGTVALVLQSAPTFYLKYIHELPLEDDPVAQEKSEESGKSPSLPPPVIAQSAVKRVNPQTGELELWRLSGSKLRVSSSESAVIVQTSSGANKERDELRKSREGESADGLVRTSIAAREDSLADQPPEKKRKPEQPSSLINRFAFFGDDPEVQALLREKQEIEAAAQRAREEKAALQRQNDELNPQLKTAEEKLAELKAQAKLSVLAELQKDVEAKKRERERAEQEKDAAEQQLKTKLARLDQTRHTGDSLQEALGRSLQKK